MDEKEKVLNNCAEDAWYLYQACLRASKALRDCAETTQEQINRLNSKIADVMIDINAIVDADILSHESIESKMIKKLEERGEK